MNSNNNSIKAIEAYLESVTDMLKNAHECASELTHIPKKDAACLGKLMDKARKAQNKLYGEYSMKTWRTTKPPKLLLKGWTSPLKNQKPNVRRGVCDMLRTGVYADGTKVK